MTANSRQYECILFGATGYTGKYAAEHITTNLPTNFRWAVAGRSGARLRDLVDELRPLNPDRTAPSIETASLDKSSLVELVKKTKVLATTVGPFHKYGTAVLEACAENGTHYLDVTGEVPWVSEMIEQYHATAQRTGAIIIPQNGLESAPADLMCWKLASTIRERLQVGTREAIVAAYDMKASPSGGTLATALTFFDTYKLSDLIQISNPWCLCPIQPPSQTHSRPLMERITGVRTISGLGTLTDSVTGGADIPIVHRSWGLYGGSKLYGADFHMTAYARARNAFTGLCFHFAFLIVTAALLVPPIRWIAKYFVYSPGDGPTREQAKNEYIDLRCIAYADTATSGSPKQVYGRMRWEGSMYHLTGVCTAEAALILAREKTYANELGGGILTPATLGETYLERLRKAGLTTEFRIMP